MALTIICKVCRKKFPPTYRTPTVHPMVCSCKCAVVYYEKLKPKTRKLALEVAKMVGRRSMGEVTFEARFIEGKSINAKYEADSFKYVINETRTYTPDWVVTKKNGYLVYLEFKGVLDGATRKKMKLIKKQYPRVDIRFVFQRAANKIYRGSKTTYGDWADQHGFLWTDNTMPKDCTK